MIGLIYLVVFASYFIVAILLTLWAVRAARRRDIAGWKWGVPTAFGLYLLVFWDHVPTILLHKYECANNAGLTVYKTPEQWKIEHPGEGELIQPFKGNALFDNSDGSRGYWLNDRFIYELRPQHLPVLPVTLGIDSIIDTKSHETLVQRAWVTSGYGSLGHSMKFWVGLDACNPDGESFNSFEYAYRDLRGNP